MRAKKIIGVIMGLFLASVFCFSDAYAEASSVKIVPYFAYGSNMDAADLARWCDKNGYKPLSVETVMPVVLEGHKLVFNHYSKGREGGAANIIASKADRVYGLLFFLTVEDLEKIRKKEGYPNAYAEINVAVRDTKGRVISDVFTYKVRENIEKSSHQPPTKYYLSLISDSAKRYNFPSDYIGYLESVKTRD